MASELVERSEPSTALTPLQLLDRAMSMGMDSATLKEFMELHRQWKADQAREAFVEAMNEFRKETLEVVKRKRVAFGSGDKATEYFHATLHDIVSIAAPALSKHGLSHRWETKQEGNAVTVTCILTHQLGHSEQTSLTAMPDTSGAKNSIQAIGSTTSYLQRYTFTAITGLAAKDQDDDARSAEPPELISAEQVRELDEKIAAIKTNKAAFLRWLKVENLEDIPAKSFERAKKQLDVIGKNKRD